jgi:anti-anti-sigma factor
MTEPHISSRPHLAFERLTGKTPGTIIFRFDGPFTARAVFAMHSPEAFDKMFTLEPASLTGAPPTMHIFDLAAVPYMDSAGLGMVVRHYARCRSKSVRFVAAGANPRVLALFSLTKVDTVLPLAATVEQAEAPLQASL